MWHSIYKKLEIMTDYEYMKRTGRYPYDINSYTDSLNLYYQQRNQLWNISGNSYIGVVNTRTGNCLETKNGVTKEININDIEPLEGIDDPIRIEIQSEVKLKLVEL